MSELTEWINSDLYPANYYGKFKLIFEEAVKNSGLDYVIFRPSNVFGINNKKCLITNALINVISNKRITIWGTGDNVRDFIYINNFTQYVKKVYKSNIKNETFNIASGKSYSVMQVLKIIKISLLKYGYNLRFTIDEKRFCDVGISRICNKKISNLVKVKKTSLEDSIDLMVRSLLN
jgi:UDP-glucose 4-epimerase